MKLTQIIVVYLVERIINLISYAILGVQKKAANTAKSTFVAFSYEMGLLLVIKLSNPCHYYFEITLYILIPAISKPKW